MRILREAKARGVAVTAEVTPHHLTLTDASVIGYDTACKVNPPLREQADVDAVRAALADGTIDAIATDHAPHSSLEKDCEFSEASPGMIGLELVVPVLLELVRAGRLPLARLGRRAHPGARARGRRSRRRRSARAPSRSWCWSTPRRCSRRPGAPPLQEPQHPWLGKTLTGEVRMTLAGGRVVFDLEGASRGR